jgi:hypothetical protein
MAKIIVKRRKPKSPPKLTPELKAVLDDLVEAWSVATEEQRRSMAVTVDCWRDYFSRRGGDR